MELEALLREVRWRLGRTVSDGSGAADRLPPWRPPGEPAAMDTAARLELFVDRARDSRATVHVLRSRAALEPAVLDLFAERGWRTMLCAEGVRTPALKALGGAEAAAEFGLCEALAAAAETGSMLLAHDAGNPRGVSLLPAAVGFVVRASAIVPRLTGLLELLDARGEELDSCVTLVCGPSRSADIGPTTCFGAHGPGMVWVWVIESE